MAASSVEDDTERPVSEDRELEKEWMESGALELVSIAEEDLPKVETPTTFNVSSFSSQNSDYLQFHDPDHQDPHMPIELPAEASAPLPVYKIHTVQIPPSPGVPVIKVQPFLHGDDLSNLKSLCWPYFPRRLLALLIILLLIIVLILILGVGLGVGLRSCSGRFRCASSPRCISRSDVCNGVPDCSNGEDELSCVRLSGRQRVLQVFIRGSWRTICSEGWDSQLGSMACRQLGYSSFVSSAAILTASIEAAFQNKLVAVNLNQTHLKNTFKIHNSSYVRKTQCSSGLVTTVKCIECGTRPGFSSSRIVGGNVSRLGQIPWQVSLNYQNQYLCSGSVISERWILTAAHCVYGFAQEVLWSVYAGVIDQPLSGAGSLSVEKILYHANYQPKSLRFDVALMKLALPLSFNNQVMPICLPSYEESFMEGQMCLISGWGSTVDGGEASVSLHVGQVPLLSRRDCHRAGLTSWNICAGVLKGGAGTCQGDSGGPLACQTSGWTLAGAASWDEKCGQKNKPGVYTSITEGLTWIQQQMEKEENVA